MNKLLIINLTRKTHHYESISNTILKQYLGGRGLGVYLLYKMIRPGLDPFDPENMLMFSVGPIQGTDTYYSSRAVLTTKSPLTGIYLYSVASGHFGHEIKKAGYTALIIQGKSAEPMYLTIENENIAFRSARHLWGLNTIESQKAMLHDAGIPHGACACIGQAGERLSPLSVVATGGEKVRTFGRGGAGAVMGSKNLKGIVVSGTHEPYIADKKAFSEVKRLIRESAKASKKWVEIRGRFGTGGDMIEMNELGHLPTRNWQTGVFEGIKGIALTEIEDVWPRKKVPCGPHCITPCSHISHIDRGPWKGATTEGPEYETLYAFGTNCGVDQFDAIVAAEQICDTYGIDTVSLGATIAFAMECFEKGLISKEDTHGLDLRFGNAEAMVKAAEMIAVGKALNEIFGQGVKIASKKIPHSSSFAMHCKGLEFGGYECRGAWGQALQFALSPRGACHHAYGLPARSPSDRGETGTQINGKGELIKDLAIVRTILDSLVMCSFPRGIVGFENMLRIIDAITGMALDPDELKKIGLRIIALERMFNVREGLSRKDDYLPKRLLEEPLPDGPHKGSTVPMDELLDQGYKALGWDTTTGIPLKQALEELDLLNLCT